MATSPYERTATPGSCSMDTYLRSPVRSLSRNSVLVSCSPLECTYVRSLAKNFSSPGKSPLQSVFTRAFSSGKSSFATGELAASCACTEPAKKKMSANIKCLIKALLYGGFRREHNTEKAKRRDAL